MATVFRRPAFWIGLAVGVACAILLAVWLPRRIVRPKPVQAQTGVVPGAPNASSSKVGAPPSPKPTASAGLSAVSGSAPEMTSVLVHLKPGAHIDEVARTFGAESSGNEEDGWTLRFQATTAEALTRLNADPRISSVALAADPGPPHYPLPQEQEPPKRK